MAEVKRLLMPGNPRNGIVWNSGRKTQGTKIVSGKMTDHVIRNCL
jgi:hypothetical protein